VRGKELFGPHPDVNAAPSFQCSHCKVTVKPARFTTHLEKCMGLGRAAGRTARRANAAAVAQHGAATAALNGVTLTNGHANGNATNGFPPLRADGYVARPRGSAWCEDLGSLLRTRMSVYVKSALQAG